jgi:hypothetical protein
MKTRTHFAHRIDMMDAAGVLWARRQSLGIRYGDIHRRHECAGWEKTMFLLARYRVAAAVFLVWGLAFMVL